MKHVIATTESGADYDLDFVNGFWSHRGRNVDKIFNFQIYIGPETVDNDFPLPWDAPEQWVKADEPEIGKRFYVSALRNWRISTPVTRIEELPE